ncbi:hypothetical protein EJB05_00841, partial [Eragrostis curvula]
MIEKWHVSMSDDFLRSNPCITAYKSLSLNLRQELADATVPQLGAEAARETIKDWGRKASDVTHLVFCTTVSRCIPGADSEVVKLLGLPLSTKRFMLYQAGCHGGGIALRLAKDLAENNDGARVLVDIIPGTEDAVVSKLCEHGIMYTLHRDVAPHISSNIERLVKAALEQAGVVAEMRQRSADQGLRTTGQRLEWGLLFGFGPGLTVETIVLRALPCQALPNV